MSCKACGDWGLKLVRYDGRDSSDVAVNRKDDVVYAVCLCCVGERWRMLPANGKLYPLWQVWAFQHGIDPANVLMLEDAVTPEELASYGFRELSPTDALDAIAAAAKSRKGHG